MLGQRLPVVQRGGQDGARLGQEAERILTAPQFLLRLLTLGDVADEDQVPGSLALIEDPEGDLDLDPQTILAQQPGPVVGIPLTRAQAPLPPFEERRPLLLGHEVKEGRQRQQFLRAVAAHLAEGLVDVLDAPAVHDDQPLAELALRSEQALVEVPLPAEVVLDALLPGNVVHDTLPEQGQAILVPHQHGLVADPDGIPLAGEHTVLHAERLAVLFGPRVLGQHALAVVGVEERLPDLRVRHPLFRRVPEQLLHPRAHVQHVPLQLSLVRSLDVGDSRDLLRERPVAPLGLPEPGLHLPPPAEVAGDAEDGPPATEIRQRRVDRDVEGRAVTPAVDRLEPPLRPQGHHALQVPLLRFAVHRKIEDVSTDELVPRYAVHFAGSPVHVEHKPALGIVDQNGVVDQTPQISVFFPTQSNPRSHATFARPRLQTARFYG